MGNQHSEGNSEIEHPRLKQAILVGGKQLVLDCPMPRNYKDWLKKLSALSKIDQKAVLYLPQVQIIQKENFCGTESNLKLIFEPFPSTLHKQIARRKTNNSKFSQQQLWFLLYQLLLASSLYQRKKQKSGDIRPRNILIDKDNRIRVISTLTFPEELSNYYKSFLHKVPTFLAPEELAQLEQKMKYCRSDPVVAESFSIGLTVMDAALLFDSEELYDVKNVSFKNYLYNDNLVAFRSMNLSPFLTKTVLNLLDAKTFDRPTPGETLAIVQPYQQEILNLDQFIPDRERSKSSLQEFQNGQK